MAADDKKGSERKLISEKERFNFIGFDVFPGTPKDLFKSDAEKSKLVDAVVAKREKGDLLREECTLLEERVSFLDRMVLTIASIVIIATLFIPWFGVYNEVVEESEVVEEPAAVVSDSLAMAAAEVGDSLSMVAEEATTEAIPEEPAGEAIASNQSATGSEEILHSYVAKKKIHKEYSRLSGIGVFVSIGSVGSFVFSSGGILMVTGILILVMILISIGMPIYNLYGIYALKGDADTKALALKKILKFNWIPIVLFVLVVLLSFLGSQYGHSNPTEVFTSIGASYSVATLLGSLSYGVIISLSAFILIAVKGVEI